MMAIVLNRRRASVLLCLALLFGLLSGCGGAALPSPTARSVVNVLEGLALLGATIRQAVSGDAGCAVAPLYGNAVRLVLTLDGSAEPHEIHLFRWRRQAQYEAAAADFADCLDEYRASAEGEVEVLELAPWRAFGRGWNDDLSIVLEEALRAAGGG